MKISGPSIASLLCATSLFAAPDVYFGEDVSTYPVSPPGPDQVSRPVIPNSRRVNAQFLSRISGAVTESFEGMPTDSAPTSLTFGSTTATLSGTRKIFTVPNPAETYLGLFPITGTKLLGLLSENGRPSLFTVTFSTPQSAFGFFGSDLERNNFALRLIYQDNTSSSIPVPVTLPQGSGGAFFFGVIDKLRPFTSVEFMNLGGFNEYFGFDDLTIGVPEQVHPEPPTAGIAMHTGIQITGTVGETYRIEYTLDLTTPNWITLADIVLPTSPYTHFDPVPVSLTPKRFYRVSAIE